LAIQLVTFFGFEGRKSAKKRANLKFTHRQTADGGYAGERAWRDF